MGCEPVFAQQAAYAAVLAWLAYAAVSDLRTRRVPWWAGALPLVLATLGRALAGGWALGLLLAAFLAVAEWPRLWPLGVPLCGLVLWLSIGQDVLPAALVWLIAFILWSTHVIGGADAHVALALVALFPDALTAWLLLGSVLALSLAAFVRRYGLGLRAYLALVNTWSDLLGRHFPASEELQARGVPLVPALALAGFARVLWAWIGVTGSWPA